MKKKKNFHTTRTINIVLNCNLHRTIFSSIGTESSEDTLKTKCDWAKGTCGSISSAKTRTPFACSPKTFTKTSGIGTSYKYVKTFHEMISWSSWWAMLSLTYKVMKKKIVKTWKLCSLQNTKKNLLYLSLSLTITLYLFFLMNEFNYFNSF